MQVDDPTLIFEANRTHLVRLAYRMLGDRVSADDIVQDAWLRWRQADRSNVQNPAAFLSRIVTRLCLDEFKSARARRETYVGTWLPEPIIEADHAAETAPDLTLTLMLVLERLSPLERAAYLLHDLFNVPLAEIAVTLDRDSAAVRQLAARARKHVRDARPRFPVSREEGERISRAFSAAALSGDVATLRSMLAETVVLRSDGGGKATASLNPILGIERVLRLYSGLHRKDQRGKSIIVRPAWIDGLPGYISLEKTELVQTTAFAIEDGAITNIFITRNPEKLGAVRHFLLQRSSQVRQ